MSIHVLENDSLTLQFDELGAKMISISDRITGVQYLWDADPDYWKRHSPILFPFVGTLKDKSYQYAGNTYSVMPHGFARDMYFTVTHKTQEEIWFALDATDKTKEIYPFDFRLELGYRLESRKITVLWRVLNKGQATMYFSIGGHPAFYCPLDPQENQSEYYFAFDTLDPIHYLHIDENGLVKKKPQNKQNILTTDNGILPIDSRMFDYDALIIENDQCHQVSLLDTTKLPYLTVTFEAPLFGLWSPAKKNAPFVCIEPWYGRCDGDDFNGTLEEREFGNSLSPGGVFDANYTIEIA